MKVTKDNYQEVIDNMVADPEIFPYSDNFHYHHSYVAWNDIQQYAYEQGIIIEDQRVTADIYRINYLGVM